MGTAKKMTSAITGIKLNRATFSNELIDQLTYVNFFYGNNGAGKSSIAKAIESSEVSYGQKTSPPPILKFSSITKSSSIGILQATAI